MYDYESLALSRLTSQFEGSTKLRALISAIVNPLNTVENTADTLKQDRWIATAIGKQLDGCGYIVGEPRLGRNDDDYRNAIRFRVFVNISKGTPTDLIRGLKFLTQPTDTQYLESYPATALLFTNGINVNQNINEVMQDLSPAGISDISVAVSYGYTPFRFAKEPPFSELFVDGQGENYLTADGSDIQLSTESIAAGSYGLGGIVPSELEIDGAYLDLGGTDTLAVYEINGQTTLGHDNLTGVFQ